MYYSETELDIAEENIHLRQKVDSLERKLKDKQNMLEDLQKNLLFSETPKIVCQHQVSKQDVSSIVFGRSIKSSPLFFSSNGNLKPIIFKTPPVTLQKNPEKSNSFLITIKKKFSGDHDDLLEFLNDLQKKVSLRYSFENGSQFIPFIVHHANYATFKVHSDDDDTTIVTNNGDFCYKIECHGVVWWNKEKKFSIYWTFASSET